MKHSSLYEVNILMEHLSFLLIYVQEDRERMVVRRFKFEDPRIEQIQELEVYIKCIYDDISASSFRSEQ